MAVGVSRLEDGVFVEVNDAFCRLFQFTREQVIGHDSAELALWPDLRERERLIETVRQQGSATRFEARYRNSLGEFGDLEVSVQTVRQAGQAFMVGFLTEVTDRREFVAGLQAAQSRLGVVLRASSILVFGQDAHLRYTWVANPALGVTEAELLGQTDEDILGTEAAAPLVAIKRRVLATGQPERRDVWVAHNGQLRCFDLVVEPERDTAGRLAGIVCAAQDITPRVTAPPHAPVAATLQGMTALIGREPLTPRQSQRLQRIERAADRLSLPGPAGQAAARLRARHAGALVVVAEGQPVLREQLAALLEHVGLRVVLAATGVEAFSFSMQWSPALLLLDLELPQRGGIAAAQAVRAMAAPGLPIVAMLSGWSPAGSAGSAGTLDVDVDDVLDKPVAAAMLYPKLLAWLDAHP